MGIARVDDIQRDLLDAGMAADMPAAVVSQACTPRQRHALCRLDTLEATVRASALASPAVLVLGRVVHGAALSEVLPQAAAA
jgi:siroheme synthase